MKKQLTGLSTAPDKELLMNLTTEVKEVLITGYKKSNSPMFSNADLWNIQRCRRVRPQRQYF